MRHVLSRWTLTVIFFLVSSVASKAQDTTAVNRAVELIQTLCVSGGGSQQQIKIDGSIEGGFAISRLGIGGSGKFLVENTDLQGVVNGLDRWIAELSASEARSARECMSPHITTLLSWISSPPTSETSAERKPFSKFEDFLPGITTLSSFLDSEWVNRCKLTRANTTDSRWRLPDGVYDYCLTYKEYAVGIQTRIDQVEFVFNSSKTLEVIIETKSCGVKNTELADVCGQVCSGLFDDMTKDYVNRFQVGLSEKKKENPIKILFIHIGSGKEGLIKYPWTSLNDLDDYFYWQTNFSSYDIDNESVGAFVYCAAERGLKSRLYH